MKGSPTPNIDNGGVKGGCTGIQPGERLVTPTGSWRLSRWATTRMGPPTIDQASLAVSCGGSIRHQGKPEFQVEVDSSVYRGRYMSYVKQRSTGSSIIAVIVSRTTANPINPSHTRHQSSSTLIPAPPEDPPWP